MKITVSNKAYINALASAKNALEVSDEGLINNARFLKKGFTENASVCISGILKGDRSPDCFMFHSKPEEEPITNVIHALRIAFEKFKENNDKIRAFITGGSSVTPKSKNYCNFLMELFEKNNIEYSAIVGQKSAPFKNTPPTPMCDLFCSGEKNEVILSPFSETGPERLFGGYDIRNLDELKQAFDIVKICFHDLLFFSS